MEHRIDVTRPSPPRVYDYLLGGRDNYAVDRALAETFLARWPDLATNARVNRAWVGRVVTFLAGQGIDQFLDIGSGLPTADSLHQVAQRVNPDARVLYVDNDPIVLVHARALLAEDARTDYVAADAQDTPTVLGRAAAHLDRSRPVALLMAAVLHYAPEPPARLVAPYVDWLPPGSYVAISHATTTGADPEVTAQVAEQFPDLRPRPAEQIAAAFAGLELLEPGVVDAQQWRPETDVPVGPQPLLAGVARVP